MDAHGGPLSTDVLARVQATNVDGTGAVRRRGSGSGAAGLSFTAAPTGGAPDNLPQPAMGVLPDGRLGPTVSLWPSGALHALLTRDFAQVAVLSIERHLVGQARHFTLPSQPPPADEAKARRARDQNRDSTGLRVQRANRGALRATIEAATTALLNVFEGAGNTTLVAPVLERDWGVIAATLPDADCPQDVPSLDVKPLVGGGEASGGTVGEQRVLVTLTFASAPQGTWVRAWSQGFDSQKGEHFKLDGGAGAVDGSNTARLVVTLPQGAVSADAQMGIDLVVVTGRGHRFHSDLRFDRPTPATGGAVSIAGLMDTVHICEAGRTLALPPADGSVPSGATLIAIPSAGDPKLIDRTTIPDAAWDAVTAVRRMAAGDIVQLCDPAFQGQPKGDDPSAFSGTGATVGKTARSLTWEPGRPLPTMERLEVVASNVDATLGQAALGGAWPTGASHELLPHRLGHPLCPATSEVHGVGVFLQGPAAVGVAEFTRDRTAGNTIALVKEANTPIPEPPAPQPEDGSVWVVGLRTVAAGVEAEIALGTLLGSVGGYPLGGTWDQIKSWLGTNIGAVTDTLGTSQAAIDSIVRAVDRRMLLASRGGREGATSLDAAFGRAQDFVYIETPAVDALAFGPDHDTLDIWGTLVDRMDANPGLHVVLCVPVFLARGTPKALQRVRDGGMADAIAAMQGGTRGHRFVAFHPSAGPGRSLRLATTTVIVDDTYCMAGTTHLWRRGLSFDASYAVALTDERLQDGRAQEVASFRRTLMADRLGLAANQLPDDPAELVASVRMLAQRGGHGRLAAERFQPPDPTLTTATDPSSITEADIWNRDGSAPSGFDPVAWFASLLATVRDEEIVPAP